jgi:hypothetical protein
LECGGPAPLFKLLDQSQLFVIKKRRRAVGLGAAELGIEPEILATQSHELVLDGQRVKLTKLEFEVFRYLYTRKGRQFRALRWLKTFGAGSTREAMSSKRS